MNLRTFVVVLAAVVLVSGVTLADPLPDQFPKFQQMPMVATPIQDPTGLPVIYYGHDEASQANLILTPEGPVYEGNSWMADDFADPFALPVVHVQWWGSYIGPQPVEPEQGHITKFLIEFLSDQPAMPDPNEPGVMLPSRPLALLQYEVVEKAPAGAVIPPGSGLFTEKLVRGHDPILGENLYMYNAELSLPFSQEPDTVYWLKIVALEDRPEEQLLWGWHNRDYTVHDPLASVPPAVVPGEHVVGTLPDGQPIWHFQDDAVRGGFIRFWQDQQTGEWLLEQDLDAAVPQNYLADIDGPELIAQYSKDLAFVLYTVPEPTTLAMLLLGGAGTLLLRRRR